MICNICFDEDNNLLTTPCNHTFHCECLKRIVYPQCPLCKCDIKKTLNSIGVSTKKINQNITAENFRIFLSHIDYYDDIAKKDLFEISIKSKALNNVLCFDKYREIVMAFIDNISDKLLELSNMMFENNEDGLFLYYCDVTNFILNINDDYSKSILAWKKKEDLKDNKIFISPSKKLFKNIDNNHFGLLIIFHDDLKKKNFIYPELVNTDNKCNKLPTFNELHKTLCEFDILKKSSSQRENIEKDFAIRMKNYYHKLYNNIQNEIYYYKFLNSFLESKINNLISNNVNSKNILQFNFIDLDDAYNFMYLIQVVDNKISYKYLDCNTNEFVKITTSNISYFLMRYFKKYTNSYVRFSLTENNITKLVTYDISYDNELLEIERKDPYETEMRYTSLITDKKSLNIKVDFI